MSEQKVGCVPDGYMPIPTAEQIADALDGVRCYHDMSAELIAPELLANLLAALSAQQSAQDDEYPPCDYCGAVPDYHPWHGSGALNSAENPHIHACNECRHLLPSAQGVSVPRELLERVATHLEWDGDESQTVIQYANKCDALAAELRALLNGGEA